jgi:hypothetical protein
MAFEPDNFLKWMQPFRKKYDTTIVTIHNPYHHFRIKGKKWKFETRNIILVLCREQQKLPGGGSNAPNRGSSDEVEMVALQNFVVSWQVRASNMNGMY